MAKITAAEYEARRQARIDRIQAAAERARKNADDQLTQARKMAEVIPFGLSLIHI